MKRFAVLFMIVFAAMLTSASVEAQSAKPAAKPAVRPTSKPTANDELLDLVKRRMPEAVILKTIETTKAAGRKYNPTAAFLGALQDAGASEKVIMALMGLDNDSAPSAKIPAVQTASKVVMPDPVPVAVPSGKPTVAVLVFDYGAVKKEWSGVVLKGQAQPVMDVVDVGSGITDLLTQQLLEEGSVRLLERKKLESVTKEQDLAHSNRAEVSAQQAAQLSKLLGARYFVAGSVTKFGNEDSHIGGLGGAAGMFTGFVGALGMKKSTARVNISGRIIDSSTGEILKGVSGAGESKRKGLLIAGLGAGGGNVAGGGFDMGSSNFQDTILGEATLIAVKEMAAKLTKEFQSLINP